MKPIKLFHIVIVELLSLKKLGLILSLYSFIMLVGLLSIARKGEWTDRGIFDLVADSGGALGGTNHYMFFMIAIPVITIFLFQLLDKLNRPFFVLGFGSRFRTWHVNVIAAICISILFTIFILCVSILIAGLWVGFENTWQHPTGTIGSLINDDKDFKAILGNLHTTRILLFLFISKFLGSLLIAFSVLFLRNFFNNAALVAGILILLSGLDQTGVLIPIYTWMATLTIYDWMNPINTIYHMLYLFVVTLILYAISGWLYERKDFL